MHKAYDAIYSSLILILFTMVGITIVLRGIEPEDCQIVHVGLSSPVWFCYDIKGRWGTENRCDRIKYLVAYRQCNGGDWVAVIHQERRIESET